MGSGVRGQVCGGQSDAGMKLSKVLGVQHWYRWI